MIVTRSPAPRSAVRLEVELPAERLGEAVDAAVRRLARRTRVPGFRPGKAPRIMLERVLGPGTVLEEAVEHLVEDAYREAVMEQDLFPIANPDVEILQAEEGRPLRFAALVPVRPEVRLGDYRGFNFRPEIEPTTDEKVEQVIEQLRDQHATLGPVDDRPARAGDYAIIRFATTVDGQPVEHGSSERMPLILGDKERELIPGFEDHVVGLAAGQSTEFDLTYPDDYPDEALRSKPAHFSVTLLELREKLLPELDDDFAKAVGDFADLAALRSDIRRRLERSALDRARHEFSDRIITYAVANATVELPDALVDQETEVMHDEFRVSLARQGIGEEAYLKVTGKTEADLHTEFRPRAEERAKTLLVLSRIAEAEGVEVPEDRIERELAEMRERYARQPKMVEYFDSDRGRTYLRSSIRRSLLVEKLVDDWLSAHPDHPPIPHAEDDAEARPPEGPTPEARADADPGAALDAEPAMPATVSNTA